MARRHGPGGYKDYGSYRPWLRDEFTFRCVYCLIRERWGRVTGEFDLDHFAPQVQAPNRTVDYGNLLYTCHRCNLRKGRRTLPGVTETLTSQNVRIYPDGSVQGLTDEAERIIRVMSLNSGKMKLWRRIWLRIIQLAQQHDAEHYRQLMGYPDDLPDLSKCDVPTNTKQDGIDQSYFVKRLRGELADTYLY